MTQQIKNSYFHFFYKWQNALRSAKWISVKLPCSIEKEIICKKLLVFSLMEYSELNTLQQNVF